MLDLLPITNNANEIITSPSVNHSMYSSNPTNQYGWRDISQYNISSPENNEMTNVSIISTNEEFVSLFIFPLFAVLMNNTPIIMAVIGISVFFIGNPIIFRARKYNNSGVLIIKNIHPNILYVPGFIITPLIKI